MVEATVDPAIRKIVERYKNAKSRYENDLNTIQDICPHTNVMEMATDNSSYWLGPKKPRRICAACGYEEEGALWADEGSRWNGPGWDGWRRADRKKAVLGSKDARFIVPVDDAAFYRYRLDR